MLLKYRSLLIFAAVGLVLGVAFGIGWIVVTGEVRPPWWGTVIAGVVAGLSGDRVERWWTRRQTRRVRAHVEGPRPTNPDGTPYGFHQLRAGGWEHCDGCGLWGNAWTPELPHQCQQTHIHGPVTTRKASR